MTTPRYLTKSRFKLATECPTKLFYTGKKDIYPDTKLDDPFLQALADGGYQVGELAKCYYAGGVEVSTLDYDEAERQTRELLKEESVIIYEPAIRFHNLFIRVDILVKHRNRIELIEVKAKSYSMETDGDFMAKRDKRVASNWRPYLYDVAFQKYVLSNAFPEFDVSSYLLLVDKNAVAATSGLNQKFRIKTDTDGRKRVVVSDAISHQDLENKLLVKINTDEAVQVIYDTELTSGFPKNTFIENIGALADLYEKDQRIAPAIGRKCKDCEFRCSAELEKKGYLNGVKQCWKEQLRWQDGDFDQPTVLDIWNFRGAQKCLEQGVIKLTQVTKDDIGEVDSLNAGLQPRERQWLQVEKAQNNDSSIYFDAESLRQEMNGWVYPLHFIDFETNAMAIPFYQGMKPYEGIAFQFSHHLLHADGKIEHAGEFLNTNQGEFPNFEFVRELKRQLEKDEGTIFRYSSHENTYLNKIHQQLKASTEPGALELCDFIKSITRSTASSTETWIGTRCMVDLIELVKSYYYDPRTNGSNSIKQVLPAILASSSYLQNKYAGAVYGTTDQPSNNFECQTWIQFDSAGNLIDPYKLLPKMFKGISDHDAELLSDVDELNNGGMALTAYGLLQFVEMSDYERAELNAALLKYCELDTLAMVMIVEAWREWMKNGIATEAA